MEPVLNNNSNEPVIVYNTSKSPNGWKTVNLDYPNNKASNEIKSFDFYGFSSTNNWKVLIMFDELNLPFNYHPIDLIGEEQFSEEFKNKININSKVPVIVDNNVEPPFTVIESGAILIYLAEKYGKFLPDNKVNPRERSEILQWVSFQISTIGPMFGQLSYFNNYCDTKVPIAIERYTKECDRILKVVSDRLSIKKYIGGDEFSIADISCYGWFLYLRFGLFPGALEKYPIIKNWLDLLETRPSFSNAFYYASADIKQRLIKIEEKQALANNNNNNNNNNTESQQSTN